MARADSKRELEVLVARTKKVRHQIQSTWQKFENLEAAVESARDAEKRARFLLQKAGKEIDDLQTAAGPRQDAPRRRRRTREPGKSKV